MTHPQPWRRHGSTLKAVGAYLSRIPDAAVREATRARLGMNSTNGEAVFDPSPAPHKSRKTHPQLQQYVHL
ncbi:hypothetical protein SAMN00790413_00823 [Deinococcus hopiensis KR-140]|uniref:Uncharacterized protein n=1 Tax=Deinococcus hopiensis KR-140 TaxID=695939 RepID=A0A1W1VB98_9DEIO|nr:hypothetical protein SAMN00790413_00823 [Deinococcus hopiensis KR-140]